MDKILNSIPLYILIPAGVVVVIFLALLIAKAFLEGREISFWPPKIGPRPTTKIDNMTTGAVTKIKPVDTIKYDARLTADIPEPRSIPALNDRDIGSMRPLEVIARTNHSVIEKCICDGEYYVLKRTDLAVCQPETMKQLVGKEFIGYGGLHATIATPLRVWTENNYVCEL